MVAPILGKSNKDLELAKACESDFSANQSFDISSNSPRDNFTNFNEPEILNCDSNFYSPFEKFGEYGNTVGANEDSHQILRSTTVFVPILYLWLNGYNANQKSHSGASIAERKISLSIIGLTEEIPSTTQPGSTSTLPSLDMNISLTQLLIDRSIHDSTVTSVSSPFFDLVEANKIFLNDTHPHYESIIEGSSNQINAGIPLIEVVLEGKGRFKDCIFKFYLTKGSRSTTQQHAFVLDLVIEGKHPITGNSWESELIRPSFKVKANGNGNYTLKEINLSDTTTTECEIEWNTTPQLKTDDTAFQLKADPAERPNHALLETPDGKLFDLHKDASGKITFESVPTLNPDSNNTFTFNRGQTTYRLHKNGEVWIEETIKNDRGTSTTSTVSSYRITEFPDGSVLIMDHSEKGSFFLDFSESGLRILNVSETEIEYLQSNPYKKYLIRHDDIIVERDSFVLEGIRSVKLTIADPISNNWLVMEGTVLSDETHSFVIWKSGTEESGKAVTVDGSQILVDGKVYEPLLKVNENGVTAEFKVRPVESAEIIMFSDLENTSSSSPSEDSSRATKPQKPTVVRDTIIKFLTVCDELKPEAKETGLNLIRALGDPNTTPNIGGLLRFFATDANGFTQIGARPTDGEVLVRALDLLINGKTPDEMMETLDKSIMNNTALSKVNNAVKTSSTPSSPFVNELKANAKLAGVIAAIDSGLIYFDASQNTRNAVHTAIGLGMTTAMAYEAYAKKTLNPFAAIPLSMAAHESASFVAEEMTEDLPLDEKAKESIQTTSGLLAGFGSFPFVKKLVEATGKTPAVYAGLLGYAGLSTWHNYHNHQEYVENLSPEKRVVYDEFDNQITNLLEDSPNENQLNNLLNLLKNPKFEEILKEQPNYFSEKIKAYKSEHFYSATDAKNQYGNYSLTQTRIENSKKFDALFKEIENCID